MTINSQTELLCFSHLRWDFVFQRPQHLMTRFAEIINVYFLEEPIFDATAEPHLELKEVRENLRVCVPHLPGGTDLDRTAGMLSEMLQGFFDQRDCNNFIFWYYTPMALEFSSAFKPAMTIYDCMDELSAFDFAPPQIRRNEQELLRRADLVFTGGMSLYEAKKAHHHNIHPFPSSIDKAHFGAARELLQEPCDQSVVGGVKLGFFGVIDERFDQMLIRDIAAKRPDWQIVLIGPVVKIDPALLPHADNIHYLGTRTYQQLPSYLAGWDVALIPFQLNESTRFISPTKTPEYLAAGKPVVSTPIRDVISPYHELGLVSIGTCADEFIAAIDLILLNTHSTGWLATVDDFLADKSWEHTFSAMLKLITKIQEGKNPVALVSELKNAS